MDKRSFLKNSALLGVSSLMGISAFGKLMDSVKHLSPAELAVEDDFWLSIRNGYRLKPDYINLENGYYSILPEVVLEQHIANMREVNLQGAYYMRTVQYDNKKKSVIKLAELVGCSSDELIITRNTTESLDMIISGQDWQKGDEAIMAEQDYGAMLEMFKQVSKRYGIVNKIISIPNHPTSDDEIVQLYANAITPKTKLLMVCHMINITGQILPVRKICDMAHSKNVPVMVDGAHAIAHIKFSISDLNCDYYGASLHKWLSVPLGSGMLYVKQENILKVWPLFAESEKLGVGIARLNHTGTIPVHTDLTISASIDYFQKIGAEVKETRLRYLQNYWTSKVRPLSHVLLNTPEDVTRSCAIANVGIKDMKPMDFQRILLDKYKIYTVAIDTAGVHGCRITPNVYTTTHELDMLVKAIEEIH